MRVDILTLFPGMFESPLKESLLKKAIDNDILNISFTNIRDYSTNKHHKVDDYPYGGGKGLVISPEPVILAYESIEKRTNTKTIFLSPGGKVLSQDKLKELSHYDQLILLCGHYEGIDQRAIEIIVDEEISIGDYILTGGELPALVLIDGVSRYLNGVVGSKESVQEDSLSNGLLKYPQYTNPRKFRNKEVPEILLNGHHKNIENWRKEQSYKRTQINRPDLWQKYLINKKEGK